MGPAACGSPPYSEGLSHPPPDPSGRVGPSPLACGGLPAAGVIGEAMVAFELARALLEKFGADSLKELSRNLTAYARQVKQF